MLHDISLGVARLSDTQPSSLCGRLEVVRTELGPPAGPVRGSTSVQLEQVAGRALLTQSLTVVWERSMGSSFHVIVSISGRLLVQ